MGWWVGSSAGQGSGGACPPQLTGALSRTPRPAKGVPLGMALLSILLSPLEKGCWKSKKKACPHLPKTASSFACLLPGKDSGTI